MATQVYKTRLDTAEEKQAQIDSLIEPINESTKGSKTMGSDGEEEEKEEKTQAAEEDKASAFSPDSEINLDFRKQGIHKGFV